MQLEHQPHPSFPTTTLRIAMMLLLAACGTSPVAQAPLPDEDVDDTSDVQPDHDVPSIETDADADADGDADGGDDGARDTTPPPPDGDAHNDGDGEHDVEADTAVPDLCDALQMECDGIEGPVSPTSPLRVTYGSAWPECRFVSRDGSAIEGRYWISWISQGVNVLQGAAFDGQWGTSENSAVYRVLGVGSYDIYANQHGDISVAPPEACTSLPRVVVDPPSGGFWAHLRARDERPIELLGPNEGAYDAELWISRTPPLCRTDSQRIANSYQQNVTYDWGVRRNLADDPRLMIRTPAVAGIRPIQAVDGLFVADAPHPTETWTLSVATSGTWSDLRLTVGWAGRTIHETVIDATSPIEWLIVGSISFGGEVAFDEILANGVRPQSCGSLLTDPPDCSTDGPFPDEICDGIDNDCDGSIDEAPDACIANVVQPSNCVHIESTDSWFCM